MTNNSRATQAASASSKVDEFNELYEMVWEAYPQDSVGGEAIRASPATSAGSNYGDYPNGDYPNLPNKRTSCCFGRQFG